MSNYSSLKATINANIKTNGNQEITGSVLNSVLNSMVDALGAGYLYKGIAVSNTSPGTPDTKVFYLAVTPGTYTNFGGLVVADGEVAILKWDTSWHKDVTGLATADQVNQLSVLLEGITKTDVQATETSGKFISAISGALANSSGFAYTGRFYVESGKKIIVHARGYQTAVAMIAKVVTDGQSYTPLVASIDSNVRDYSYIVTESGYYAASFSTADSRSISVVQNTPDLLQAQIAAIESVLAIQVPKIEELEKKTDGAEYEQETITENTGKYIGYQGTLANGNEFAYTNQFYVEKGSKIVVRAKGYLTYVCMIAKVVTDGQSYTPKVMSIDSNLRDYSYIAEESGYYAASFSTADSRSIHISTNTPETLSLRILNLETQVDEMMPVVESVSDKLSGITEGTITPVVKESNKFINYLGNIMSSNGFAYSESVFVRGGSILIVNARGYLTSIAIISKQVAEGVYSPKVVSDDSTLKDYQYIVEEDGYYAFSWTIAQGIRVKVINYPTNKQETRLQENIYCGVPSVGIIGDSLASGASYNPSVSGVRDNIDFAWWKAFERKSGMTYRRFCVGGMSTRSFITNSTYGLPVALTAGNECALYIIGLGVNDRAIGTSYLGSVSDIDTTDPDNNGDTYYGNYARIIQKISSFNPGCKFILFTDPRTDGDFNDAVRTIAGMFSNCYLVDLWALYSSYFVSGGYFAAMQDTSAHYPSIAYQTMAKLLEAAVDDCINNNLSDFLDIQYQ